MQPRWGEKPGTEVGVNSSFVALIATESVSIAIPWLLFPSEVGVNRHGHNVTGCKLMASCHPVKTMQNDVSGSVPEVIRHNVIVGSLGRCLYIYNFAAITFDRLLVSSLQQVEL